MILIQLIKAALVVNTDLKERQILNGSNWTGLNSTPSRCTWEAPWTQNKLQKAPKPGRTFSLIRRTSIVHRCFLDNSAKKTTHTSEQSMESIQDTSLPLLFLFNQFPVRRNYPKEEKLSSNPVWKDPCNSSPSTCQPCFPSTVADPEALLQELLPCQLHTELGACWRPVLLLHLALVCLLCSAPPPASERKGQRLSAS